MDESLLRLGTVKKLIQSVLDIFLQFLGNSG